MKCIKCEREIPIERGFSICYDCWNKEIYLNKPKKFSYYKWADKVFEKYRIKKEAEDHD
jgi:hypothetical protein